MAALNRPGTASYTVHESVVVDTQDNEDHKFCGIMFPIKVKENLPVDRVIISSISVRGQLGDMSVWVSNQGTTSTPSRRDENRRPATQFRLARRFWTQVYQNKHNASMREYRRFDFSSNPIVLLPGQVRILYVHSSLESDEAIVYDNTDPTIPQNQPRFQDAFVQIHTGKAHLSPTPFGQVSIWGWGNAWRDRREFVGRIEYGTVFKLWTPTRHWSFGPCLDKAAVALLLLQRRPNSVWVRLPDECVYYILNMVRWDWFGDSTEDVKQRRRRTLANHPAIDMDTPMEDTETPSDDHDSFMADDEEDADDGDDDIPWHQRTGHYADYNVFTFRDEDFSDGDGDNERGPRQGRHRYQLRELQMLHENGWLVDNASDSSSDSEYVDAEQEEQPSVQAVQQPHFFHIPSNAGHFRAHAPRVLLASDVLAQGMDSEGDY